MKTRVKIIFAWYDFWIGLFYDKKKNLLYVFPVPMFGIVIDLTKPAKKFMCYEIHRPNIPDDGCKEQCKECADKQLAEEFMKL